MIDPSYLLPPDADLVIISRDYGVIYIRDEISVKIMELILERAKEIHFKKTQEEVRI